MGYSLEGGVTQAVSSKASMPGDPMVLRCYTINESWSEGSNNPHGALEKSFHQLLASAGHSKTLARSGGTEWFATTVEFLDQIALTLDLNIEKRELD